jgi:hypothetical protein
MNDPVISVFIKPDANTDHWFYGHHEHFQKEESGAEKVVRLKTSRRYGDGD